MSKATSPKKTTTKTHFEEWMVEVKGPATDRRVEKVKLNRPRVLMPDEMVATLNEGVLNMDVVNNNRLPFYYFPVEEKEEAV